MPEETQDNKDPKSEVNKDGKLKKSKKRKLKDMQGNSNDDNIAHENKNKDNKFDDRSIGDIQNHDANDGIY